LTLPRRLIFKGNLLLTPVSPPDAPHRSPPAAPESPRYPRKPGSSEALVQGVVVIGGQVGGVRPIPKAADPASGLLIKLAARSARRLFGAAG